jgi:polysaccharide biosynthesis protein PslG
LRGLTSGPGGRRGLRPAAALLWLSASLFPVSPSFGVAPSRSVLPSRIGNFLGGGLGLWAPREVWVKDLDLAKASGIGLFRFNADVWDLLEPSKGRYDFSRLDVLVELARARGLDVLFTFPITSKWNHSGETGSVLGVKVGPSHFPTKDLESFGRLAREISRRYKKRIRAYEVWNEPDFGIFWKGKPDPAEYLPFLKAGWEAVKAEDPDALILVGGLAKPADASWMDHLLSLGGGSYFDRMNIHVYPAFATLDRALEVQRGLLKKHGISKPFWITETSTTGYVFETKDTEKEERAKADYVGRFYAQALSEPDVETAFWHCLRNPGRDVGMKRDLDFGLMTGDGRPLPAYTVFKDFMSRLSGAEPLGPRAAPPGGRTYAFRRTKDEVWVFWGADGRPVYAVKPRGGKQ